MKRLLPWIVAVWCLFFGAQAQAASFDCAKASTKVEKLICGDAELSKLNEDLAVAYQRALQNGKQAETLKQAQKQWLKERNGCANADCVKRAYAARLQLLSDAGNPARHEAASPKPRIWSLREGKGYVLCEAILKIANRHPYRMGPNVPWEPKVPWEEVLAVKGVTEPPWEELDPAAHEDLFLKAWEFYEGENRWTYRRPPNCLHSLDFWFLYGLYLPERAAIEAKYCAEPSSETRRHLSLATYRQFVAAGGKLKLYRFDWHDESGNSGREAILQYEMPPLVPGATIAYLTIAFLPDLSKPITEWTCPASRLLLYRGEPFIFEGYDRHMVHKLTLPTWECGIDF